MTVQCPNCGSTDLKDGAAVEDGKTFDYGCRDCRRVFNIEKDKAMYQYTDDRTGEAMLACVACDETWPEDRIEDGRCPDCRGA